MRAAADVRPPWRRACRRGRAKSSQPLPLQVVVACFPPAVSFFFSPLSAPPVSGRFRGTQGFVRSESSRSIHCAEKIAENCGPPHLHGCHGQTNVASMCQTVQKALDPKPTPGTWGQQRACCKAMAAEAACCHPCATPKQAGIFRHIMLAFCFFGGPSLCHRIGGLLSTLDPAGSRR